MPVPLRPGNLVSIEPGYYEEGSFGIRTESMLHVVEAEQKGFLKFEYLTRVPIDTGLVDYSLLAPSEKEWLHGHNAAVRRALAPLVQHDPLAVRWLHSQ